MSELQSQLKAICSEGVRLCAQAKQEDFDEQIRQELNGTVRAAAKVSHCHMTPLLRYPVTSSMINDDSWLCLRTLGC